MLHDFKNDVLAEALAWWGFKPKEEYSPYYMRVCVNYFRDAAVIRRANSTAGVTLLVSARDKLSRNTVVVSGCGFRSSR